MRYLYIIHASVELVIIICFEYGTKICVFYVIKMCTILPTLMLINLFIKNPKQVCSSYIQEPYVENRIYYQSTVEAVNNVVIETYKDSIKRLLFGNNTNFTLL